MINSKNPTKNTEKINFDNSDGIIQFKIVYWGPGESGKTTNFIHLREKFNSIKISNGFSIETSDGRTLWQDALFISFKFDLGDKLDLGGVNYDIITQIVTCTGQERFLSTREYVLDGADGIVFVGDSDPNLVEQNKRSFRELIGFVNAKKIPYVVQLNKRDLDDAIPINSFKKSLGLPLDEVYSDGTYVIYPTIALEGKNIVKCFQDLLMLVIYEYFSS